MEYKGYIASVSFSEEDDVFVGRVLNVSDMILFDGKSVEELHRSFQHAIDEYLEDCHALGRQPCSPFSGEIMLQIPPEIHGRLYVEAARNGCSLNDYLAQRLTELAAL